VIGFLFWLTLRQLIGKRSTLALLALAAVPVVLALIFRLSDPDIEPERWTVRVLYLGLVVTTVLSLTALLIGTSVIGDELEDGTASYLLTKPISRWQILVGKLLASWAVTAALVVTSTGVSGLIALQGLGGNGVVLGFSAAMLIASLAYSTAFVLLSVVTSRALIAGLVYAFIWEGAITEIFRGTRYLSIRHQTIGLADWLSDAAPRNLDAYVRGETALVLMAMVIAAGFILAGRRLERIEVRESS
jgi:ABC-2 type transport system permease protein